MDEEGTGFGGPGLDHFKTLMALDFVFRANFGFWLALHATKSHSDKNTLMLDMFLPDATSYFPLHCASFKKIQFLLIINQYFASKIPPVVCTAGCLQSNLIMNINSQREWQCHSELFKPRTPKSSLRMIVFWVPTSSAHPALSIGVCCNLGVWDMFRKPPSDLPWKPNFSSRGWV